MNKYSEWIFEYLKNPPLNTGLHSMCNDFTKQCLFFEDDNLEIHDNVWTYHTDDKFGFFWLLALVDQETADSILGR